MNQSLSIDSTFLVCVGGGRIGIDAAMWGKGRGWAVVVIDRDRNCQVGEVADEVVNCPLTDRSWEEGQITLVLGDATKALLEIMEDRIPDYVVPGVGGHLLARLTVSFLETRGFKSKPDCQSSIEMVKHLPKEIVRSHDIEAGLIVLSRMPLELECLDECGQPIICPVTCEEMPSPVHEIVSRTISMNTDKRVVATTSWLGHYGALEGGTIMNALDTLLEVREGELLGVATSCRCHGIINLLRICKS